MPAHFVPDLTCPGWIGSKHTLEGAIIALTDGTDILHENSAWTYDILPLITLQSYTLCTLTGGAKGSSMLWLRFHRPSSPLMFAVTNSAGCFGDLGFTTAAT